MKFDSFLFFRQLPNNGVNRRCSKDNLFNFTFIFLLCFQLQVYFRNTDKFIFFQNTSKLTRQRYGPWGWATSSRLEYQYAIYGHSTFYIELKISFQFMFQAQYEELSLKYIPRKTFDNQILTDPSPPTPLHIMEFYACFMVFLFLKASLS